MVPAEVRKPIESGSSLEVLEDNHPVVKKTWGYEYVLLDRGTSCQLRILFMRSQRTTSLHAHPVGNTVVVCIDGVCRVDTSSVSAAYGPGTGIEIAADVPHRLAATTDSVLAELQFPYGGISDLRRIKPPDSDDYMRGATARQRRSGEERLDVGRRVVPIAGGFAALLVRRGERWPSSAIAAISVAPPGLLPRFRSAHPPVDEAVCFVRQTDASHVPLT